MARIHFIRTDLSLSFEERNELAAEVERALAYKGLSGDMVIIMEAMTWMGSVPLEEPS